MLYKQWLGAKCTVTMNGGQNNANKTEWGNDISLMKRLGNICLTVISHLDTSTCTKLRYYIKLLVRSCSSWGNMTDLGLHGGWACVQMIKDRNVDTSLCAHVDTHTWCCLSVNLNLSKPPCCLMRTRLPMTMVEKMSENHSSGSGDFPK